MMLREGRGVEKDYGAAMEWCLKAAKRGDRDAMEQIGKMYEYGQGVATNEAEAVKWYSKATEKGNKDAKAALQALQDRQKPRKEQARKVSATDEA
jgi:TPR repeat protein